MGVGKKGFMAKIKESKFRSFIEDLLEIAPALLVGAVTTWGAKLAWAKCIAGQMWIAKGFFGCLAGFLAIGTILVMAIIVIFFVEIIKDYVIRSKE